MTRRLHALRPVEVDERGRELVSFCGHCCQRPEPMPLSRSPRACARTVAWGSSCRPTPISSRAPDEPFLVVDNTLSVCALSATAEQLFGIDETDAVNKHIADFLVPADANAPSAQNLLALLVDVASGSGEPCTTVVRPRQEFGVRFWARIGPCGSPRAALLVLS